MPQHHYSIVHYTLLPHILFQVLVPIIGNHKCRLWHKEKAIAVQLHDEMFCAGHKSGKRDACLGDSGGPLGSLALINDVVQLNSTPEIEVFIMLLHRILPILSKFNYII